MSTAIRLPRSYEPGPEVGTWFPIDPQPASISPTINISIVFICAFPVDCGQIICHTAIKNDSSAVLLGVRFRPIRQSSISPIVCFHQSNQNCCAHHPWESIALFARLCFGLNEPRVAWSFPPLCFPVIRRPAIKNDSLRGTDLAGFQTSSRSARIWTLRGSHCGPGGILKVHTRES